MTRVKKIPRALVSLGLGSGCKWKRLSAAPRNQSLIIRYVGARVGRTEICGNMRLFRGGRFIPLNYSAKGPAMLLIDGSRSAMSSATAVWQGRARLLLAPVRVPERQDIRRVGLAGPYTRPWLQRARRNVQRGRQGAAAGLGFRNGERRWPATGRRRWRHTGAHACNI
jgi:hypothetical protein